MKLRKNKSEDKPYVGRFAPSPSGPLHLGSMFAALASYLDARAAMGTWLLRVEDIDHYRCDPRHNDAILNALEAYGLNWDGDWILQSHRLKLYQHVYDALKSQGHIYYCNCTRKSLAPFDGIYPGICRHKSLEAQQAQAKRQISSRVLLPDSATGDVLIRRKDGQFAYHFVVVIDDALQKVTDIVRGRDLLSSESAQVALQGLLEYPKPRYHYTPVITDSHKIKLSKQTHAKPVSTERAAIFSTLIQLMGWLGLPNVSDKDFDSVPDLLEWATDLWPSRSAFAMHTIPIDV